MLSYSFNMHKLPVALPPQRGNHLLHIALGVVFLMILCVELCKPSGDVGGDGSSTVLPPLQTSTPDGSHRKTNAPLPTPQLIKETNSRTSIQTSRTTNLTSSRHNGLIRITRQESRSMRTNKDKKGSSNYNPNTVGLKSSLYVNPNRSKTKPSRSMSLLWLYSRIERNSLNVHTTGETPDTDESRDYNAATSSSQKPDGEIKGTWMTIFPTPSSLKIKGFMSSAILSNGGNKPPISSPFTGSVAVTQRSIIHPEASPSFLGPNVILTAGSGSQTKFLQPGVSKTQSQRMPTVSPTPTPYPTVPPPHFCDIGPSQSCICMNCEGNTNQGFPCCIDVLDPVYLKEGIVLSMTSISLADFLAKQPKLQKILGELVADHCAQTSCTQDIDSKRLKRNVMNDDTGQNTAAKEPDRYIRSWNSSAYKPSNTIRPYPPKNSPTKIVLSTIASNYPPLTRPVDVKVVVFKIAQNVAQNEQLSAGLYVAVTSSVGGTNRTYVLKADLLSGLIRSKRDVLKRKLNITIDSITTWKEWQVTHSIRPRVADSVSSGFTPTLGASVTPGPKSPNVESQEGGNSTTNMSRGTFIIVLVTGIGGFVVLSVIIIYMLFKFLRRMKGEFVPDKVYPNEQKANGGSDQLIPSFVDPSSPRITDVPKKTVRPGGSSGSSGDPGSGGGKKNKKPMGVKVTYKPPKWD